MSGQSGIGIAATVLTLSLAGVFLAAPASAQSTRTGARPDARAVRSAFERLKGLEGEWVGQSADAATGQVFMERARFEYRQTGAGTTLVEFANAGTPEEMLSAFFIADDMLILQHYCSAGNQPRLALVSASDGELVFDLVGGTGFDPDTDGHIHHVRFLFPAAGPVTSYWSWNDGGVEHHVSRRILQGKS